MKKKILYVTAAAGILFFGINAQAQILEEENVTITMDLQPILQLNMTTADQVEFVFADIGSYTGGLIKYGATQLRVSSSVNWDLYAVGYSTGNQGITNWDNMVEYGVAGVGALSTIPLDALELRQTPTNTTSASGAHYGNPFPAYVVGGGQGQGLQTNTIHVDAAGNPYNRPVAGEKYIAGDAGQLAAGIEAEVGGSYLTSPAIAGVSRFFYTIDYRIIPGLPAVFPMAAPPPANPIDETLGQYARSGVYTMNVKYVLLEDI